MSRAVVRTPVTVQGLCAGTVNLSKSGVYYPLHPPPSLAALAKHEMREEEIAI